MLTDEELNAIVDRDTADGDLRQPYADRRALLTEVNHQRVFIAKVVSDNLEQRMRLKLAQEELAALRSPRTPSEIKKLIVDANPESSFAERPTLHRFESFGGTNHVVCTVCRRDLKVPHSWAECANELASKLSHLRDLLWTEGEMLEKAEVQLDDARAELKDLRDELADLKEMRRYDAIEREGGDR